MSTSVPTGVTSSKQDIKDACDEKTTTESMSSRHSVDKSASAPRQASARPQRTYQPGPAQAISTQPAKAVSAQTSASSIPAAKPTVQAAPQKASSAVPPANVVPASASSPAPAHPADAATTTTTAATASATTTATSTSAPAADDEKKTKSEPSDSGSVATGAANTNTDTAAVAGATANGPAGTKAPERGRVHAFRVNSSRFIIDARYLPLKPLGRGAYGVVCSAVDQETNCKVAIKKIGNAFDDVVDGKRILREVKMLHHFRHENIVSLADLVEPPPGHPFKDVYMVLEFMETDLHKIIYSKNQLTDDHVQYFMYQAVRALKYIHSAHVIHRDLKPSNLLLNGNCDLKICDFGLARGLDETVPSAHLTEYVVTRWYRAPEVMYSVQDYSFQIDVWALGCILAELLGKAPLWPGDDYIRQMNLIFDVLGTPTEDDMSVITNARALAYIRSLPPRPRVPWRQLFPSASEQALDLLNQMLQFNPARRITVQQALEHPYFADLRNPESETTCEEVFDYSFEREGRTKEDLQRYMWDEIYAFRPWLRGVRGRGYEDDGGAQEGTEAAAGAAEAPTAPAAAAAAGASGDGPGEDAAGDGVARV